MFALGRFDTRQDVASVREGRLLRREECEAHSRLMKTGPGQWTACLFIEEPFDRTNAARSELATFTHFET